MESTAETKMFVKQLLSSDMRSLGDASGTKDDTDASEEPLGMMEKSNDTEPSIVLNRQGINGSSCWMDFEMGDSDLFKPTRQEILLKGSDIQNSHVIYGQVVDVIPSEASRSTQAPVGSNKVKINPVVNFDWEHRYYIGNLVAVHQNQLHIAYVLRGRTGGIVRVTNRKTAERLLLKNFVGRVVDIGFAFTSRVILGAVDEPGNMYIYEITEGLDSKLGESLLLHVVRPPGSPLTDFHRLIWCAYIPDDLTRVPSFSEDYSMLLLLTHNENAEVWHVGKASTKFKALGPVLPSQVTNGFHEIRSHTKAIIDAVFSPDGTAVATASLDGSVKFFQFDVSGDEKPKCIHQWQPHGGSPLSCIFFLDNHKHVNAANQCWKFAVTGVNHNSEFKIWSCETWNCLQTIRFCSTGDPSAPKESSSVEPCIKACLDLSATYLVLSDISRQVLYILELFQDSVSGRAHVCSLSEFLLMQPCLSFSILDAGRRRLAKEALEEYGAEHVWSCTTGEIGNEDNGEDVTLDTSLPDVGVLVRLYSIHTRAMQELQIRYKPQSSVPKVHSESSSSMTTDVGSASLHDHLSDASDLDRVSDHLSNSDRLPQLQVSPGRDSITTLETPTNRCANAQPVLLTPDAFISPRRPENQTASSVSDSLTLVTSINEDESFHSGVPLSIIPSVRHLTDSTSNTSPSDVRPFPSSQPGLTADSRSENVFEPNIASARGSVELEASVQLLDDSHRDGTPMAETTTDAEEGNLELPDDSALLRPIGERSHLSSTASSSSASQEVNEIFGSQNRSSHRSDSDHMVEDENETLVKQDEVENISEEEVQPGSSSGSEEEEEAEEENEEAEEENEEAEEEEAEEEEEESNGDDEEDVDSLLVKRKEAIDARIFGPQEWPQAAGVINVDELIQKTEEANRQSLKRVEQESFFAKKKLVESQSEATKIIQQDTTESKDQDQSSPHSVPSDRAAYAEIKKSMEELMTLVQMQKVEIDQLRSQIQQQRHWTESVEQLQQQVDSLSEMLQRKMAEILLEFSQTQFQQLQRTMQDLSARNYPRYEEMVSSIVRTVQESIGQQVNQVVQKEVQSRLIPCIEGCLEPMKEQFHVELAQRLTPIDAVLKDNIGRMLRSKGAMETISQAAAGEIHESLGNVYKNIVVPSLDKSCQNVMQQMSSIFQHGIAQHLEHLELNIQQTQQMMEEGQRSSSLQLQGVAEAFHRTEDSQRQVEGQLLSLVAALQTALAQVQPNQLSDEQVLQRKFNQLQETLSIQVRRIIGEEVSALLHEQQSALNDQLQSALRSEAATPIHAFADPQQQQQQISALLRQGKYDAAFQQALSATDLTLVEFVCESTDPSIVFSSDSRSPLGQPVLLSLIQQLSADLHTKTELKHRYLEEAILNLDHSNHVTREHLSIIVSQLCNKLSSYIQLADPKDRMAQPMAKLRRVCELLLGVPTKRS